MKKTFFAMMAVAALLLGMTGCSNGDNPSPIPSPIDNKISDEDLIGLWWDEFDYADKTEDGVPFTRVLLAVIADADHTGCIYLGAFDGTSDEPVAIYGGPEDAGFTWKLLPDGRIQLGDPVTGETYALTRGGGSYGNNMTDVSNTNLTLANGSLAATNANYSGSLERADAATATNIEVKLRTKLKSNVDLESGGKAPSNFSEDDIR